MTGWPNEYWHEEPKKPKRELGFWDLAWRIVLIAIAMVVIIMVVLLLLLWKL